MITAVVILWNDRSDGRGDFLACRDSFPGTLPLHLFWEGEGEGGAVKYPVLFFLKGGGYSSVAILVFTCHDPIAWNRLLTNSFVSFTQSFCFTVTIIFRRKHNELSNTESYFIVVFRLDMVEIRGKRGRKVPVILSRLLMSLSRRGKQ